MTNDPWCAVVGFPRWTADATFTAGSEADGYPASSLGTLPLSYPWRSAGLDVAQTTNKAVFSAPRKIGVIVFGPHNCSIGSTYEIRTYYDAAGADLVWSSGSLPIWPAVFTEDQVDWDGGRWWDRTYTPEEVAGSPWYRPTQIPVPQYVIRVDLIITDPLNPAGFVQSCLMELAEVQQFSINFAYGAQYGYRVRTQTQEADGGTQHRRRRPKPRQFKGSIQYAPRDDALGIFMEMRRQLDIDTPFFWWPNPTDEVHMLRNAFMAHFTDLDLQTYAAFRRDSVPLSLEEEL